ncbi:PepSY domain-containing protein [Novosphingobium flavum]|uniref:PepSY domain-containing protein n=1 Tax=Novosphingobium flavum TaxID=1778672 RepID=A0A7X1FTR6_9SPHN|nr:PepSY domain-containing protein [Novosphingobium flavum]MBC2666813.1 PepSY domain-containing protein [Novosphingobium flavum]
MERTALYRIIWRWHFYAGLFVVPMVLVLALTGAVYLFKPQLDHFEERHFRDLPTAGAVSPEAQVAAALAAHPGAQLRTYRLPEAAGDAAMIHVSLPGPSGSAGAMRDVFVAPQGQVLGTLDPDWRIAQVAHDVHGQLLLGPRGSWLVELAASWAIVMILSGLYLWWPDGRGLAGVVWPRLGAGRRVMWRDLHAVTGFWVSGLAMVLLLTGLPWADVWGSAFKAVRTEMGWMKGPQDWTIGGKAADSAGDAGEHAGHDHAAMMAGPAPMPLGRHVMPDGTMMTMTGASLNQIVARAKGEHLPFPVIVTPPGMAQGFGSQARPGWSVRSDTQNRPERVTLTYDAMTGKETGRETFADKHVIDRVVGYGVAWHEGQLLGLGNQLVGLATALMLVTLAVSGFVMWRRRRPEGRLGAPPRPAAPTRLRGVAVMVLALALFLPLLALSLIALWLVEQLVLPRLPGTARWLGLRG